MSVGFLRGVAMGALAAAAATASSAQTSDEIEQLRREYDQQLRIMQQAFEERIAALEEKTKTSEYDLSWYWKDGLRFGSEDGRFEFKLGGFFQWESAWFDQDSDSRAGKNGEFEDSTELRRSRLGIEGLIYQDFGFKVEYDFVEDGDSEFKDVFVSYNNIPYLGQLKAGHFKEPFSLENMTSDKDVTFIERAALVDLTPERNAGLALSNSWVNDRIAASAGIFRESDGDGDAFQDGGYSVTGRVTGLPWVGGENGQNFLHVGVSASLREDFNNDSANAPFTYASDGEVHLAPTFLDIGDLRIEDLTLLGVEAAFVYGPFHTAGEYIYSDVSQRVGDDLEYEGWYLQAGWFITGESRPYKAESGSFDKLKPKHNFQISRDEDNKGWGAWELAARYSHLDLEDDDNPNPAGEQGESDGITVGINWYLNANLKMMLNYNHVEIDYADGTDEDFNALQTRMQVTW